MIVGYDSGDLRRSLFTYQQVCTWLDDISANRDDWAWLQKHCNDVYHAIRQAYTWSQLTQRATRALLDISRHMLAQPDPQRRWWKLYFEALNDAFLRKDNLIIGEIYAYYGQATLLRGDVEQARDAFNKVIHDLGDALNHDTWTTHDWTLAEKAMLAYIGLVKVETWDYSGQLDLSIIDAALALAHRLNDRLLTDLLYQSLAGVYGHWGDSEKAVGYALTSLGYSYRRGDYPHALATAVMLAAAYRNVGLLDAAHDALKFAHRLVERANYPHAAGLAAYEQGVLEYYRANFEASEQWVLHASQIFEALQARRQSTMTEHLLGSIALERGQYALAEQRLTKALAMWQEFSNTYQQSSILYDLADLSLRAGRVTHAYDYIGQAKATSTQVPAIPMREILINMIHEFQNKLTGQAGLQAT